MEQKESGMTLLVPLDGSAYAEQALPFAQLLAGPDGEIRLITVVAPPDYLMSTVEGAKSAVSLQRWISDEASGHLQNVADRLRASGVASVTTTTVNGDPGLEILAAATDPAVSMIVMSSAGRGALGRLEFGSVADRVARTATIPVMIVRQADEHPPEPAKIGRVVVPLDGSERAMRALPVASALAKRLSVPVLLMTASDPGGLMYAYGAPMSVTGYEVIEEAIRHEMESRIEGPARELEREGLDVSTTIETGPPAIALSRLCDKNDIIVMTSHGRSGITRWLIGSVAEQLVRKAPVPVVLVPARE